MKAMNSRGVQEPDRLDLTLDEKLAALVGGDVTPVSKARMVVARLDHQTASRIDRVPEIRIKSLAPPRHAPPPDRSHGRSFPRTS
jgi:hypothetical protein